MAIRFVDVEREAGDGGEARPARPARAPAPIVKPVPDPVEPPLPPPAEAEAPPGDASPLPGLPHAKPEPKARGRKKPMAAVGTGGSKPAGADAPAAPLLEGLLPELQAHAKPTPKPRGRKKAFG